MKKTVMLSIVLVALVCAQGFSQSWIVGGEAGLTFGSRKSSGTKTSLNYFTLSPTIGYVIDDKIDVGGRLILESGKIDFTVGGTTNRVTATTFGLAAWGRYYLLSLGSLDLRAWGEIGFSNTSYSGGGTSTKSFWISAVPNLEYRFTDRVSIYTNIGGVGFERSWRDSNNSETSFGLSVSDQISLGFFLRF
jgi:long-subunit fatty acid transport protein